MPDQSAVQPPAVRVPTLEPSASSLFTGTRMLRTNLYERQVRGSTLSDHYQPKQANLSQQHHCHEVQVANLESQTNKMRIEELLCGICGTNNASVLEVESFGGMSPPPRKITPTQQQTPPERFGRRSASPERTPSVRPSSMRRASQGELSARPAWNQNCPTPRVRPIVSVPQTEPRRLTRDMGSENRVRPWLEGMRRTHSLKDKLTTEREKSIRESTPMNDHQDYMKATSSARKASPAAAVVTPRTISRGARDLAARKDEAALHPRLDCLEKLLQDAQQRAARAEARCEEMEVALQTLALQHRGAMSRLEERNAQLNAQVQHMLQWMEHVDATRVARDVFPQEVYEDQAKDSENVEDIQNLSISNNVFCSPSTLANTKSANTGSLEVSIKATPVRVPPAPPMTLQLQQH